MNTNQIKINLENNTSLQIAEVNDKFLFTYFKYNKQDDTFVVIGQTSMDIYNEHNRKIAQKNNN